MARRKKCAACKARPVKSATALYCADAECERARARGRRRSSREAARSSSPEPETEESEPEAAPPSLGGVFYTTSEALAAAGRINTPLGQNALKLATWMDAAGSDSGGGKAALSKQHIAALEAALADVEAKASPLDELRARREARGA